MQVALEALLAHTPEPAAAAEPAPAEPAPAESAAVPANSEGVAAAAAAAKGVDRATEAADAEGAAPEGSAPAGSAPERQGGWKELGRALHSVDMELFCSKQLELLEMERVADKAERVTE